MNQPMHQKVFGTLVLDLEYDRHFCGYKSSGRHAVFLQLSQGGRNNSCTTIRERLKTWSHQNDS